MKLPVIIIIAILFLSSCDCLQKADGVVLDSKTRKPISNVVLGINEKEKSSYPRSSYTDSTGRFNYSQLAGGACPDVVLYFSKKGYKTVKVNWPSFSKNDTVLMDRIVVANTPYTGRLIPVAGYRFTITGDFDGDGSKEKLTEHFFNSIENKETNKFYDSIPDYGDLVELAAKRKVRSFLSCSNKKIGDLIIDSSSQQFGLFYLKNEGDLDGDGADEISYVVDWADWSNTNSMDIMTYKNNAWKPLYSFDIWEWQLPPLPTNDTLNQALEKQLKDFDGLIKKIHNNKIRIIFDHNADLDTTIIDLKHPVSL